MQHNSLPMENTASQTLFVRSDPEKCADLSLVDSFTVENGTISAETNWHEFCSMFYQT